MGNTKRVLFVCTGNQARSQIAEALLRSRSKGIFEAYSAGSQPKDTVHPLAIRVLEESGVDAAGLKPKGVADMVGEEFDYVFTLCSRAQEACPVFPGAPTLAHWNLDDPAAAQGTEEQRLDAFRAIRDEIDRRIGIFLELAARNAGVEELRARLESSGD
jgi:arsenate reductase